VARAAYRPSLTEFTTDWGVETSLRIAFLDLQSLLRAVGDLYRLVLEVGYAHWSIPQRSFGVPWSDAAPDTGFVRAAFEPHVRDVP
jgi:hypothetical protein